MDNPLASSQTQSTMATTTVTMPPSATITATGDDNCSKSGMAYRPPPSSYLTIDNLIRKHATEENEIPMIGYPQKGVDDYEVHTAKNIDRYVDAACWWYQNQGLKPAVSTEQTRDYARLF